MADMSTGAFLKASQGPYRKLISYLKPYRGRFSIGILFGALFGATNLLLLLTIRFAADKVFPGADDPGATLTAADKSAMLTGDAPSAVALNEIVWFCAAIPLVMALRGLFSYLNSYCMAWVSLRVLSDIRIQLFSKLMNQSLGFFGKKKSGELIQTVFNQTRMAQQALTTVASDVIKQPISIISALTALFIIDWKFTLIAFAIFPLCILPVLVVGKRVRKAGGKEEEEAGMLMVVMQEAFAGIRVVKSHGRENYEIDRFTSANQKMMVSIMRWRKALEAVGPAVEAVASLGIAAALVYVWLFDLSPGKFIALNGGFVMLYPPFKTLSRLHILLQKCIVATTKVFELMERPLDIPDRDDAVELTASKGDIKFDNVTFKYKKNPAVNHVSLHVPTGQTYALVGPSGAGKSTMLALLLRFYDPQQGVISVDGHDLRDLFQISLRDQIGIVNQDTFLFHDTIYNNILYGQPNASKAEVIEAAKRAHAHGFIEEQDKGYDTVIGDKGCNLSGGQQQRLSIARAILRDAPILLLDEAMSALDTESEQKIKDALDTLAEGKTVIAIAHRLSTILNADKIVVMEEGTIADIGTHEELISRSDLYQRLYNLQFSHAQDPEPA